MRNGLKVILIAFAIFLMVSVVAANYPEESSENQTRTSQENSIEGSTDTRACEMHGVTDGGSQEKPCPMNSDDGSSDMNMSEMCRMMMEMHEMSCNMDNEENPACPMMGEDQENGSKCGMMGGEGHDKSGKHQMHMDMQNHK